MQLEEHMKPRRKLLKWTFGAQWISTDSEGDSVWYLVMERKTKHGVQRRMFQWTKNYVFEVCANKKSDHPLDVVSARHPGTYGSLRALLREGDNA